jgi:cysteine desulfurase
VPEARAAVTQALDDAWGNPSSVHALGRKARAAIEGARQEVAALLGASADGVVFTSGGTEGDNLAVLGLARAIGRRGGPPVRVISTRLEHPAVLGALSELARAGAEIVFLPVGAQGEIDPAGLAAALSGVAPGTPTLVTIALANHEIGTLAPIGELARIAHAHGALFHSDAVQAVGRVPVDVPGLDVDALTVSAHKIGGPKGVGALWVRPGLLPEPLVTGGRQERERRAGTENVPGILGFGAASRVARAKLAGGVGAAIAERRDRLEARLLAIPGARRHGRATNRVPGTSNLGFAGALGELVVIGLDLDGIAVSSGAACSSGTVAPSSVLLGLGLSPGEAREAVRFSLGDENSDDEVDRVAASVEIVVARVRTAAG